MKGELSPRPPDSLPPENDGRWKWVVRCEEVFFGLLLGALIVAGLLPLVSRFFELPPILWTEALSRQLVLWLALFGAGAATRDRKHITIDAVSQFLPGRTRLGLQAATGFLSAVTCAFLVPIALAFARAEAEFVVAEGFLDSLAAWLPLVLPIGLALLALRFLLAACFDLHAALSRSRERKAT